MYVGPCFSRRFSKTPRFRFHYETLIDMPSLHGREFKIYFIRTLTAFMKYGPFALNGRLVERQQLYAKSQTRILIGNLLDER